MDLPDAIKHAIESYDATVYRNEYFLKVLANLGAFEGCPGYKFVLRVIIKNGYWDKIIELSNYHFEFSSMLNEIVYKTAFQSNAVRYVCASIQYGLGIRKTKEKMKTELIYLDDDDTDKDIDIDETLSRLVEDKSEHDAYDLQSLAFGTDDYDKKLLKITYSIKFKRYRSRYNDLNIEIYDKKGKLRHIERIYIYSRDAEKGEVKNDTITCYMKLPWTSIGKIVVTSQE